MSCTGSPFTFKSISPGNKPVETLTLLLGSAKITEWNLGDSKLFTGSKIVAFRKLNPKSFLGAFCRFITNSRTGGIVTRFIGGNGSVNSSKYCGHRYNPLETPTGLRENVGVANDEFEVSVKLPTLGEGDVAPCMCCV